MKIKVIQPFNDKECDLAFRDIGTELEVTEQRGWYLIEEGFAKKVAEPEQTAETPEPEQEEKPAKKGKKTEQKD